MESKKGVFWYKVVAMVLALVLIVPVLAACGDNNNKDKETPTLAATTPAKTTPVATTPAATTPAATLPFVDKPVKIGVIADWSGPATLFGWMVDGVLQFAKWYYNEKQGGIRVGDVRRPIEFDTYDGKSEMGATSAGAKKLLQDGVVSITMGGANNAFAYPIADVTDPGKVLYSSLFMEEKLFTQYKYLTNMNYNIVLRNDLVAKTVVSLHPKKVAVFGLKVDVEMENIKLILEQIKALDPNIEVVYQNWFDPTVVDFSPYLTRIKYEGPDVLIMEGTANTAKAIANEIMALGGWGGIQVISTQESGNFSGILKAPGAEGWIVPTMYMPGEGTPGALAFGEAWAEKCKADSGWCTKYSPNGSLPLPSHSTLFSSIVLVVKAIELAGTDDHAKVAEAAVSGKLEFDSPLGYVKIGTNGNNNSIAGYYVQVKDGKYVRLK